MAFLVWDEVAGTTDGDPELIVGSRCGLPYMRHLQCELYFRQAQVGAVVRQQQEPGGDGVQGRNKGLGAPAPERRAIDEALFAWRPAGGLGRFFFRPKNASRFRWMTMKGWRFAVQMRRRSTTSSGFCSSACRPFRVRKIEPVQNAPDRAASQFT